MGRKDRKPALGGAALGGLDALLPPRGGGKAPAPTSAPATPPAAPSNPPPPPEPPGAPRSKLTTEIDAETLERARAAAYWSPGLTLAALVETALDSEVDRLEADRGEPFPSREGELIRGRPLG